MREVEHGSDRGIDQMSREELIAAIESLRREHGEWRGSSGVAAGVSGRNVATMIAVAARIGVARESLQAGVSYPLEPAERPDAWISWDEFNELVGRVSELAGEDALYHLGEQALALPILRAVGVVARNFVSESQLIEWVLALWFRKGNIYSSGIDARLEVHGPRHLRVVFESEHEIFARAYGIAFAGVLRSVPLLLGRPPARVDPDVTPQRIIFDITLARRSSFVRAIGRRLGLGGRYLDSEELRAIYSELVDKNQRLNEKLAELEASSSARGEIEARLAQVRQMQVVGRFAGRVAHELNNLLTVIVTLASLSRDQSQLSVEASSMLAMLEETGDRAAALTRELRRLGNGEPGGAEPIDLRHAVEDVRRLVGGVLGAKITLTVNLSEEPSGVRIDPSNVQRLLLNLALNAHDAMPDGGQVTIDVRSIVLDEAFVQRHPGSSIGEHVLVSFRDDGRGMHEDVRARAFEPFFTTKSEGRSGLGLAAVYAIVSGAHGTVWLDSKPGGGTTFRIYLPRAGLVERPPSMRSTQEQTLPWDVRRTVLVIDDNPMVRLVTARSLASAGYDVTGAASGNEALHIVEGGLRPDIVVSDLIMPGVRGAALAEALRGDLGPVPILFVSGYADQALVGDLDPRSELLHKPFHRAELLARVAAMLKK